MNTLAELQDITKRYGSVSDTTGPPVLSGISLAISEGDAIAVTGPSGSGKSTLLNILGTLDQPTSGSVILDGRDAAEFPPDALASLRNRFTGFVFQLHHLLPQLTVGENILLPAVPLKSRPDRQAAEERARYLAGRVGIAGLLTKFPSQLSAGECQRTALVRALVNKPRLLLADEPTGSLDEENALLLGRLLCELNLEEKVAIVLATHSETLAGMMKTRYRLTGGKLHPVL